MKNNRRLKIFLILNSLKLTHYIPLVLALYHCSRTAFIILSSNLQQLVFCLLSPLFVLLPISQRKLTKLERVSRSYHWPESLPTFSAIFSVVFVYPLGNQLLSLPVLLQHTFSTERWSFNTSHLLQNQRVFFLNLIFLTYAANILFRRKEKKILLGAFIFQISFNFPLWQGFSIQHSCKKCGQNSGGHSSRIKKQNNSWSLSEGSTMTFYYVCILVIHLKQ